MYTEIQNYHNFVSEKYWKNYVFNVISIIKLTENSVYYIHQYTLVLD